MGRRHVTVTEAAQVWEQAKRDERDAKTRLEAAGEVLKEYFRARPNKRDWKGRIGFGVKSRRQLDTKAVRAELGDRAADFEKVVTWEELSLLTP